MGHYVVLGKGEMLDYAADFYRRAGSTIAMSLDQIPAEHRSKVVVLFESDRVPENLYLARADECANRRYGIERPVAAKGILHALAIRPAPKKRDKTLIQADRRNFQRKLSEAQAWF